MRIVVEALVWAVGLAVLLTLMRGFPALAKAVFSPIGLVAVTVAVLLFVVLPRLRPGSDRRV